MSTATTQAKLNLETARSNLRRLGFYGLLAQADGRVLCIIRRCLEAGMMAEGIVPDA